MSDDYICKFCGHRAGDHLVSNICQMDDCNCKHDPYLEQLAILRKQLAEAITEKNKWIKIYETESKLRRKDLIESDALRKQLEEEHTAALKITEQWIAKSKQLDIAMKILNNVNPILKSYGYSIDEPLAEINRIGKESGINLTIDDEDGTELKNK
jgi:hypothetical protein